jgi:TatD DNase family protein
MYVDSHCHLNFPELRQNLPEILGNMQENKVTHALCVSVEMDKFHEINELTKNHDNLFASVGVHPDYEDIIEPTVDELVTLASKDKVVAIGETGLDYFRLKGDLEWQRDRFRTHIRAANEANLPLIIHTREAREDTIQILKEELRPGTRGVLHCFTETYEMAMQAIELDFFISFSGIVTFKNAKDLKETASKIPLERMLIETDSPYLTPVPFRGKTNDPSKVIYVAEEISRLKDISVENVANVTTTNFFDLFSKCKQSQC